MPRYEWRALLATYAGGYVVAAIAALAFMLMPVLWARAVYEVVLVFAFWLLFRRQGVARIGASAIAVLSALATYLVGNAAARFHFGVTYLLTGTTHGNETTLPMSAAIYVALLVTLLVLWRRNDGRWADLVWLAAVEIVVTLAAIGVLIWPTAPDWAALPGLVLTGAWEPASRIVLAWAAAVAFSRAVIARNRPDGDTEQALQPDASRSVH